MCRVTKSNRVLCFWIVTTETRKKRYSLQLKNVVIWKMDIIAFGYSTQYQQTSPVDFKNYNCWKMMKDTKLWSEAMKDTTKYMVVEDSHTINCQVYPSKSAPRTGFILSPQTIITSRREILDTVGSMWIEIDLNEEEGERNEIIKDERMVTVKSAWIGAHVLSYMYTKGGVITACLSDRIDIQWKGNPKIIQYTNDSLDKFSVIFANPQPPPPQGWIQVRPTGDGCTPIVRRLFENCSPSCCCNTIDSIQNIQKGDYVLVAKTLEQVKVTNCVNNDCIYCTYGDSFSSDVWYRCCDLVKPNIDTMEEMVLLNGKLRSRRELVLTFSGFVNLAKKVWNENISTFHKNKTKHPHQQQLLLPQHYSISDSNNNEKQSYSTNKSMVICPKEGTALMNKRKKDGKVDCSKKGHCKTELLQRRYSDSDILSSRVLVIKDNCSIEEPPPCTATIKLPIRTISLPKPL